MPMDATLLQSEILAQLQSLGLGGSANVPTSGSGQSQPPADSILDKFAEAVAKAVVLHIQTNATVLAITPGPSTTTIL
jgi:hypothetical protein